MLRSLLRWPRRAIPLARPVVPLGMMVLLGTACVQSAFGGLISDYPLSSFTVTNSNGDGTLQSGLASLVLTGPNNGSGLPGTTDATTLALATGFIQFQYSYATLDTWDTSDPTATPNDYAGYLLGSTFVLLANQDGQSGTISIPVTLGESFGFRVVSADNFGEPGILTISDVSTGGGSVPEPGTFTLLALSGAVLAGIRSAATKRRQK